MVTNADGSLDMIYGFRLFIEHCTGSLGIVGLFFSLVQTEIPYQAKVKMNSVFLLFEDIQYLWAGGLCYFYVHVISYIVALSLVRHLYSTLSVFQDLDKIRRRRCTCTSSISNTIK